MPESMEKAYYFSKNEFLVLLGLGGLGEIYSFRLPGREEFDSAAFTLALHRLLRRGQVRLNPEPVLSAEMEGILEAIRLAERILSVAPAEDGAQKICYLSASGVAVTELAGQQGELRLSLVSREEFYETLFEGTGVSERFLENEEEGRRLEAFNGQVREERSKYLEECPAEELLPWLEREEVQSAWELLEPGQEKPLLRILFRKGCMNSWVLLETAEGSRLTYDSLEFREELRRMIFGKIEKGGRGT